MNSAGATAAVRGLTAPRPSRAPLAARILLSLLERIRAGRLSLQLPDGRTLRYGSGSPMATLRIFHWRALEDALSAGDIGFAEGYMRGDWESDDLAALLLLLVKNRAAIERAVYGGFWGRLLARLRHLLNANTRTGSRRNIAAHYDLGNDFYRLWLDPSMTYSSALFDGDFSITLEAAQAAKYRRILERLRPAPGARILEIGCGWGGFAEMAARDFGCHVTGLTLSREQLGYATARLARPGLAGSTELRLQDYRDLRGQFDHVVSIEMFEAVGERWWPDYFRAIASALKPGGRALIQSITIDDALFERYRAGSDFIQQYIFPGGMLPSPSRFRVEAEQAGLGLVGAHAFGPDYAET
ncbi:MAG: class I SAM-dependent methyltransferase, partial [Burkholderiales bacterium]|nr:class I SAM-dependent methyltransferase [Burkholderiales bacterium]